LIVFILIGLVTGLVIFFYNTRYKSRHNIVCKVPGFNLIMERGRLRYLLILVCCLMDFWNLAVCEFVSLFLSFILSFKFIHMKFFFSLNHSGSPIHSLTHSSICFFTHLFVLSFIHLFIHSFVRSLSIHSYTK